MRRYCLPAIAATVLAASLMSGCGGGAGDPEPTSTNASVTVTSATNASLNGIYATSALNLSDVEKRNPIGSEPEVCSFRFSGLAQVGSDRGMDGDIRYLPGTNTLHVIFVSIAGTEFSTRDPANATVDRNNNEIDITGKLLNASSGSAEAITLTGSIPMRGNRPQGC
jgi:hypothetical protein